MATLEEMKSTIAYFRGTRFGLAMEALMAWGLLGQACRHTAYDALGLERLVALIRSTWFDSAWWWWAPFIPLAMWWLRGIVTRAITGDVGEMRRKVECQQASLRGEPRKKWTS